MSGIVGIINLDGRPVEAPLLRRMTDFMTYRGPDAREIRLEGPTGFGHALLQTAEDCRPEAQPLSRDGLTLVADARIDDREELRRQLKARGCSPAPDAPDGELILAAYQTWGKDCVQRLIGDFAFAVWDSRNCSLFCARDHFGVKPFYYVRRDQCLVFSNTLDCLRLHPQVSDALNDLAVADFLLFGFNQDQATTTWADIKRLPPAHFLTLNPGGFRVTRYWSLPLEDEPLRYKRQSDYVERFKHLLRQAVEDRLRASRIGVMMSGGLDSSLVAALARESQVRQGKSNGLRAYTAVYDRLIPDQERHYTGLAAQRLDIPVHFQAMDDWPLFGGWDQPEMQPPEPEPDPLAAAWRKMVGSARAHGRVALTGEGGDEILYPSKSYFYGQLRRLRWGRLTLDLGRCILLHGHFPQVGFRSVLARWRSRNAPESALPEWLNPDLTARLQLTDRWRRFVDGSYRPPQALRPEAYQFLSSPLLTVTFEMTYDPGLTRQPVEFRHPLFDMRVVQFALALPPLPWCVNKLLLRETGKSIMFSLPPEILRRPKAPLQACPITALVRQGAIWWLEQWEPSHELESYINVHYIPPVVRETDPERLWLNLRPLNLNLWLKNRMVGKF
jgi:asparagine synthase (glutamine-hydrolysing)